MLRGVYFVSGTQEGTPIDRILGFVARSYHLEHAMLAPNQSSGKSFFLSKLLSEVVFAESGLAGTNLKWERRRALFALAGYLLVGLVMVGAVTTWAISYANNRRYVADVAQRVDAVRQLVQTTPNRYAPDLLPVVPALEATRLLASAGTSDKVPWSLGFGLFQGRKLDSAAHAAYERMLVDAVQPRLALGVEDQLRQGGEAGESQYEALKAYLMLRDPQRFDAKALKTYLERDWDSRLARDLSAEQRAQLSEHLDALLALGAVVSPVPADAALVAATQAQLTRVPLPQRVYTRMRQRGLGAGFPEFTIARAAGANASLVFARSSGKPLTQGVPGLFSLAGYRDGFQAEVGKTSDELAGEQGWVLGVTEPAKTRVAATLTGGDSLVDNVRYLYLNDYATAWETFITDIRIVPLTSLAQTIQTARVLSASDSPFPVLMRALSRETTLSPKADKSALGQATAKANEYIQTGKDKIKDMILAPKLPSGLPQESIVDDRFAKLRQFVTTPEGGKAPVDETVRLIGEVYDHLQVVKTAMDSKVPPPPSPVPAKVKADAPRLPEPALSMVTALGNSSASVSQIMMRQNLSEEVRAQVGEFCNQAIARRYPVDRTAKLDATPADFAQVFGPGGRFDRLVQDKLALYIDTSARPNWRFKPIDGTPLGTDLGTLPQFQRAAAIRETFFPAGNAFSIKLDFKPVEMDNELGSFVLDVDGQLVRYAHGPLIPMPVVWPGPRGSTQVRLQITPPGSSGGSGATTEGPWALFRMFDKAARVEPGNSPEKFRVTFEVDGRKAVFDVTTSSVRNPFVLRELKDFSCPSSL
jgi:type VI secretion system protein ImpL